MSHPDAGAAAATLTFVADCRTPGHKRSRAPHAHQRPEITALVARSALSTGSLILIQGSRQGSRDAGGGDATRNANTSGRFTLNRKGTPSSLIVVVLAHCASVALVIAGAAPLQVAVLRTRTTTLCTRAAGVSWV
ncbi:hypothetical protein MRX96_003657 [Rhipicephalus microplus]